MRPAVVIYHHEEDGWWAESPDYPSFFAAGDTYEDTKARVWEALPRIAGDQHLGIFHRMADGAPVEEVARGRMQERGPTGLGAGRLVLRSG